MSKINSPSSNNSATSSETSETQSVDDTNPLNNTKAVKSWRKIKDEGDKERPPWRSVSVSTLPKADKNALLRAKLLDASRRLRLSKLSVAIQVELPIYSPSRTIGIPIQRDLTTKHDVSILTDGSITLKKRGPGEFILTHSASQMTEAIVGVDTATQTLLPRTMTNFLEAYLSNRPSDMDDSFSEHEKRLINQIREIRKIDEEISARSRSFDEMSDDSISGCGDKTAIKQHFEELTQSSKTLLTPTISSWHFEYPVDDEPQWKPYTTKANPWSSFANTEIEDRLSKMKLQPIASKQRAPYGTHQIALNLELFNAVEELIIESNKLVDTFYRFTAAAATKSKIKPVPKLPLDSFEVESLSEFWIPIIEQHEENAKRLASQLKPTVLENVQPISLADFGKGKHKNLT